MNFKYYNLTLAFAVTASLLAVAGCQNASPTPVAATTQPSTAPSFALFGPPPHRSGVELWSDNCARCHNSRPPEEFSAAQWGAIVHHMRLRANLTGEEEREITKFLQAGS